MSLLANQRARSATEIVDASVQCYRAHAVPLLTIAAVVIIPVTLVGVFVPPVVAWMLNLLGNLLLTVGGAAASVYLAAVITDGEISIREALTRVSAGRVIAAQIFFGLAVMAGLFLLVVPGVIFLFRLSLATTVAAIERADSNQSVKRSWALTKGHGGHVVRTLLLGIGLGVLILLGGSVVLGLLSGALGLDDSVGDLLVAPIMVIIAPFAWTVATLLYIDLRVRNEGADIEAMVAELTPSPARTPAI